MKLITILSTAALALCGSLYAATLGNTVSVHFATPVVVGNKTLPAGDCTISVLRSTGDPTVLSLRSADGEISSVLAGRTEVDAPATDAPVSVILERRGDRVRFEGLRFADNTGFSVLPE